MDFICRVRTGIVKQGNRACAALCNCGAVFSGRVLVANYSGYNYYIPGGKNSPTASVAEE